MENETIGKKKKKKKCPQADVYSMWLLSHLLSCDAEISRSSQYCGYP